MADSGALLRMLEPAVRPVGPEGPGRSGSIPLEDRGFGALLEEARSLGEEGTESSAEPASETDGAVGRWNRLGPLSQIGAIENASLRALIEQGSGEAGAV